MLTDNLFTIESCRSEQNSADIAIKLNPACRIYEGHFPSDPITPGVCLLQIMCELMEHLHQKKFIIHQLRNVKFMRVIRPSEQPTVQVHLDWDEADTGYVARCVISDGTNTFTKITNMALEPIK